MYGNILVGLSFMALTFLTVKTFAPDIKSNAETQNISDTVGPYTMSISTDSLTSINITPTSSQTIYTGTSAISYTNTCPHGMSVTMSSASENTSLTRTGSDSGTKTIPTISSGTTLTDNTWGFSKDNGSTYNAVPALANPATIIDTSSVTTTAATLNLIYGVKTDNQLPSGSYSNDIVYTVSPKQQCLSYGITWNMNGGTAKSGATYPASLTFGSTLDLTSLTPTKEGYEFTGWSNGTNTFDGTESAADINPTNSPSLTMTAQWEQVLPMQGFSCSTLANVGDSVKLRDTRDNNVYTVKKLADGNCWMTQNLRIAGKTITSADSNVTSDFTIPASSTDGFNAQDTNNAYVDGTYGGYYTFYTATAGTGGTSLTSGNAPSSICPKGWRLPTGGGSPSEFQTLYNNYNSSALMRGDPAFTLSGYVRYGSVSAQGSGGYFWSSTVYSANDAYYLYLNSSDVYPAYVDNKANGFSVRCVAKQTVKDITYMQDMTSEIAANTPVDTVKTLTDKRDNNTYTVFKGKDGKIWMSQNLRLINKTITSEDSNIASGTSFTVPDSNWSDSLENTAKYTNAYTYQTGNTSYGIYYNYAAATAGTISGNWNKTEATYDICPKGWKLPSHTEQVALLSAYDVTYDAAGSTIMQSAPLNFVYSGYINYDETSPVYQGANGWWWSSTAYGWADRYRIYIHSNKVSVDNYDARHTGFSVRCVAI